MSITTRKQTPITPSVQDAILVAQIAVGWAGEDGGEDLFKRLLPATWTWAVLQGVREAAARLDAELRSRSHDPDELITLFRFGCFIDERLDNRFQHHKRSGTAPAAALSGLTSVMAENWEHASSNEQTLKPETAFSEYWFGARSLPRVRMLLVTLRERFVAWPQALRVLAGWQNMSPFARRLICHWHLQLAISDLRVDLIRDGGPQISTMRNYRFAILRLMEAMGLRQVPVVTGGWNSSGYRDFRQLAPAKSHSLSSCPCKQTSNDAGPITFHSRSLTTPSSTLLPPSAI